MDCIKIIKSSPELLALVNGIDYEAEKPRSRRRTKECLAVDKFWSCSDSAKFKWLLEKQGKFAARHVKFAILTLVCERSGRWKEQ